MDTQQNQQTHERHDPAIDPDTPDNHMGQDKAAPNTAPEQNPGASQSQDGAQSQSNDGAHSQENNGNQSGENSFTPDFEPEEHESPDKTKEENQTGDTDRDIDTAAG
jgi:hypothetical protein